jgi:septal ring factor EnvC (AmiA/AmiB activator)
MKVVESYDVYCTHCQRKVAVIGKNSTAHDIFGYGTVRGFYESPPACVCDMSDCKPRDFALVKCNSVPKIQEEDKTTREKVQDKTTQEKTTQDMVKDSLDEIYALANKFITKKDTLKEVKVTLAFNHEKDKKDN